MCKKCGMEIIPGSNSCPFCGGTEIEVKNDSNMAATPANTGTTSAATVSNNPSAVGVTPVQMNANVANNAQPVSQVNMNNNVSPVGTSAATVSNNPSVVGVTPVQTNANVANNVQPVSQVNMNNNVPPIGINNNSSGNISPNNSNNNFFQRYKKIIIIVGIVVVLLGIACVVAFGFLKRSPKQIFEQSIHQVFKEVGNNMDSTNRNGYSNATIKLKADFDDSNYDGLENMINKISASFNVGMDTEKKKSSLELKTNYDGSILLNANAYLDNQSLYLTLPGAYDKTIKYDIEKEAYDELFDNTTDFKDVKIVLDELNKAIEKSLKKEYFTQEKATITINGQEKKVEKSTMKLDFKTSQTLKKDIINSLITNEKFVDSYANMNNQTPAEVTEKLQESIDNLEYEYDDSSVMEISIYTSGLFHDFKGVILKQSGAYSNTEFTMIKEAKDTYSFTLKSDASETISGKIIVTNSKDTKKLVFSMKIPNLGTGEVEVTGSTKENVEVEIPNVQNAISVEQITEAEMSEISQKLLQSEGIQKILQEIETLTNPYGTINYSGGTY